MISLKPGDIMETLKDVKESRLAVEVVLRNLEILQVAAGEVHSLILDASLDHTSIPKECGRMDVTNKQGRIKSFTNIEALKCKLTLPKQENRIESLDTFDANGKHYIVSGKYLWDLSKNKVVTKLPINKDPIFFKDGVQMSVSKNWSGKKIDLWNLSSRTKEETIWDEHNYGVHGEINALAVYRRDDELQLVAGCDCGTIIFWNLEFIYDTSGVDGSDKAAIESLHVYYINNEPYMVCIRRVFRGYSHDDPIEVWDLKNQRIVSSYDIPHETAFPSSIVLSHNDKPTLILLGESGHIHVWNLRKFEETADSIKVCRNFHRYTICVEVLECRGNLYLTFAGDDKSAIIWDLQNHEKVATLSTEAKVTALRVFMNEGKPCLITGDDEGNIKLWME